MSDAPEVIVAGVDWETIAGIRMKMGCVTVGTTAYRETRRRDLPLPPLCCRQGSPETADTPATDHPALVGLPAALWMLLAGLGALSLFTRKETI